MSAEWITEFDNGKTVISHRDGVAWYDAEPPTRTHKHWAQTQGWTNYFTQVLRCPCGAIGDQRGWVLLDEPRVIPDPIAVTVSKILPPKSRPLWLRWIRQAAS